MFVTAYLASADKYLCVHKESEFSGEVGANFSAFNSGGVECEVGEFLYGLVRILKPERVLETGTHLGISASYIGLALRNNLYGRLITLEYQIPLYELAKHRIEFLRLHPWVDVIFADACSYKTTDVFDLIFLDTEPPTRFAELLKFYPNLSDGGYLLIHDLNGHMSQEQSPGLEFGWPFGRLPDEIIQLVRSGKLRPFHFKTPRGLTGFYKVKKEDYKW